MKIMFSFYSMFLYFLMFQNSNQNFQKKILNERIARLSGAIAIIQVIIHKNFSGFLKIKILYFIKTFKTLIIFQPGIGI